MQAGSNGQNHPDVSVEERTSKELVKRIRKLRWIGMEEDAKRMESMLRQMEPRDALLAVPRDTD